MTKCTFCHRKADWSCHCCTSIHLCTFHTKQHRTKICQIQKLKLKKICPRIFKFLKLEIQSRISKVQECIQEVQSVTESLLKSILSKSQALLLRLNSNKSSLLSSLETLETCGCKENKLRILGTVFSRNDSINEKDLEVISSYYDQEFFKEEFKLNLVLGHTEQAKFTLSKDYKLFVEGHFDSVSGVTVTKDNKFVLSAGDETIRIWDLEKLTQEGVIHNQDCSILTAVITRNSKYVICGGVDAVVYVWEFAEQRYKCELRGHTKSVLCLAVGKSNEIVVSGGEDGKVKVWNFIQKFLMANFDGHSNKVKSVAFSKDSKYIISGGWDENVKIWKFKKKSLFMTINFKPDYVNSICYTTNYQVIVAHSTSISVYNLIAKKLEKRWKAHEFPTRLLFLSNSGKFLVSTGQDKVVKVWDTTQFSIIRKLDLKIEVSSITMSHDDLSVIIGCEDKTLKKWKVQTDEVLTYESHTDSINCIKVTCDNRFAITAGTDNTIRVWALSSRAQVAILLGHTDWVRALRVAPNSRYLLSGGSDKVLRIWDLKSMTCKYELSGSKLAITSILFCPIYNLIVTGTEALALVWRIKDEQLCEF